MIDKTIKNAFTSEWIKLNINMSNHELVILQKIIPWEKIIKRLSKFYDNKKGATGKSLRIMIAMAIMLRYLKLSDREIVKQIKENRYIQYFCNVPDEGLQTFLHPSSLCVFRKRIGKAGASIIEKEIFETFRRLGVIIGDISLMDSTVLQNNIIYPNDVQLIFKAFKKMKSYAKLHGIPVWWDYKLVKSLWREFGLNKEKNRAVWLVKLNEVFNPALEIFKSEIDSLETSSKPKLQKRKKKALKLFSLLEILKEQTLEKLSGKIHIENRIVSLDESDARPIKKGKSHPKCEFGTKAQMSFNRQGFMITVENFIGNPNDKTLYGNTLDLFIERMKNPPDAVITDNGYRSKKNLEYKSEKISHIFLGRSGDVTEEMRDFCRKGRSATEGFIAVAKNLRGFGCSLYRDFEGDGIWSLLCQVAYNLKKFLQLYYAEKIEERSLVKLGLA